MPMYKRIGVLVGCSPLCFVCFEKGDLTAEEQTIVLDGPPAWGLLERYPRYAANRWERYARDEDGETLFDEVVRLDPRTMWPRDRDAGEIHVVHDDGTWEDGL